MPARLGLLRSKMQNRLRIEERKILRGIYGPKRDESTQEYRIRTGRNILTWYCPGD